MGIQKEACRCPGVWGGNPPDIMLHAEQWFVPERRELINRPGTGKMRLAIVVGHCAYCGGDLSTGVTVPVGLEREKLYHFLYEWCQGFKPYRQERDSLGREAAAAVEREQWYSVEENLSLSNRNAAFLTMFPDPDERSAIEIWLKSLFGKAEKE